MKVSRCITIDETFNFLTTLHTTKIPFHSIFFFESYYIISLFKYNLIFASAENTPYYISLVVGAEVHGVYLNVYFCKKTFLKLNRLYVFYKFDIAESVFTVW